jgi:tRNA-2-methylthio-N6-dimethylallyladenosine synthase
MSDDVPEEVKKRRNNELLAIQNRISLDDNQRFIGRTVEVLVEGPSKKADVDTPAGGPLQLAGRTHDDRIVVFDGNPRLIGQLVRIGIYEVSAFTLIGTILTQDLAPGGLVALST